LVQLRDAGGVDARGILGDAAGDERLVPAIPEIGLGRAVVVVVRCCLRA